MKAWSERSFEEANLLNPAFIGLICHFSVKGYSKIAGATAPYPLPFLIAPLVLHKRTREELPARQDSPFVTWILSEDGTRIKSKYSERTKSLVPILKESISYALQHRLLIMNTDGNLAVDDQKTAKNYSRKSFNYTGEVIECFKKAEFCGSWFARAGKIGTVMALLGVKP